ncbi:hypothetical protein MMC14_008542 [Varicellaria rhodocarpa]|nr:hypothetical protein [Varicellaria rhodocarpa]
MLPSHHISRPRVIHVPTAVSVDRVPALSLILSNPTIRNQPQPRSCVPSTARTFWWGRNSYTNKRYAGQAKSARCLEAHQRVVKYRSGKELQGLQQALSWGEGSPLNQYRPSQGWRLSSSWGKPNGKWPESNQLPKDKDQEEADRERNWRYEYEQRKEEIASRYEALKKKIEEDPYGMLFGNRYTRGLWDPYMLYDSLVSRKSRIHGRDTQSSKEQSNRQKSNPTASDTRDSTTKPKHNDVKIPNQGGFDRAPTTGAETLFESFNEDYDIDPITLRKVPRKKPALTPNVTSNVDKSFNILVKKYVEVEPKLSKPAELPNDAKATTEDVRPINILTADKETISSTLGNTNSTKPWLDREGFGSPSKLLPEHKLEARKPFEGFIKNGMVMKSQRIESSLDRLARASHEAKSSFVPKKTPLKYEPIENRTEDIDLLRASDIRAVSGRIKKPAKESEEVKQQRRRQLEAGFEGNAQKSAEIDNHLTKAAAQKKRLSETMGDVLKRQTKSNSTDSPIPEALYMNRITTTESPATRIDSWGYDVTPTEHQNSIKEIEKEVQAMENEFASQEQNDQVAQDQPYENTLKGLRESITKYQRKLDQFNKYWQKAATEVALSEEVKAQKAAMDDMENHGRSTPPIAEDPSFIHRGEGDMSANVHEFAKRDRWYKRKSPHATQEELLLKAKRDQQLANDQALVREVKSIYEDAYGVIDENHRQTPSHPRKSDKENASVRQGLEDYDGLQGKKVYNLESDKDSLEAELVAGNQDTVGNTTPVKEIKSDAHVTPPKPNKSPATNDPQTLTQPASVPDTSEYIASIPKKVTYKILALDHDTHEVVSAKTSSSLFETSSAPRGAAVILSHLSAPAKFIPYIEALEGTDYELVAGNRQTLVYKKIEQAENVQQQEVSVNATRQSSPPSVEKFKAEETNMRSADIAVEAPEPIRSESSPTSQMPDSTSSMFNEDALAKHATPKRTRITIVPAHLRTNPIDGTVGRNTSPTSSTANQDLLLPRTDSTVNPSNTTHSPSGTKPIDDKVRREEALFSGSPRNHWSEEDSNASSTSSKSWAKEKPNKPRPRREASKSSRFLRTLKYMFLTGGFVALFSYVVGMLLLVKEGEAMLLLKKEEERERLKEEEERKRRGLGSRLGFWD